MAVYGQGFIDDGKITLGNFTHDETKLMYPEFYDKIRNSDAYVKCFIYLTMSHKDNKRNIPAHEINKARKEYEKARLELVASFNEWYVGICDIIVRNILMHDMNGLMDNPVYDTRD